MEERHPAPGALALVEDFVNTKHDEDDHLRAPDELAGWLTERGLLPPDEPASHADLAVAVELRESLRGLLLANNGGPADPGALTTLNRFAGRAPYHLRFTGAASSELAPGATGVVAALAHVLRVVHHAMDDGSWERLKACRSEGCHWAFYDSSRNHSAAWCSMRSCGNREKARAYRTRKRVTNAG